MAFYISKNRNHPDDKLNNAVKMLINPQGPPKAGNLFDYGLEKKLNSGISSPFKIDCDFLTDGDIDACAKLIADMSAAFKFVEGVPDGGLRLAKALKKYRNTKSDRLLIVDDVLTTGGSMRRHRNGRLALGAVIFARGPCPRWVRSLFTLNVKV